MVQTHQAMNEDSLNKCIQDIKDSPKKYHFVMINVHAYTKKVPTGNQGNNSNHWVGAYINKKGSGLYEIKYVDPMGGAVSKQVKSLLSQNLYDTAVQDITLNEAYQVVKWKGKGEGRFIDQGSPDDCGPMLVKLLVDVIEGKVINGLGSIKESQELGKKLRQQYSEYTVGAFHLKRAGEQAGEAYDIKETFAASNTDNRELLEKMRKEAVITADIDLKAISVQNDVDKDKVGKVEFLAEGHHIKDHAGNTKALIDRIVSGEIGKDTVIAIERKSYGQNLGVPDVIMLANVIEHNEKNPNNQLEIPKEITKDSLIYQDAILYNTAKKHGIKVVGLEGRNLKAGKELPEEYNAAREDYMAGRITQLSNKGYNVIAYVGSAHVENLERAVESKLENKPSVENTPNKVSEELQKVAVSIGEQARAHVTPISSTTSSISVLPNENPPIKRNSGVGGR